jgi:opacity protein-like surface antigen
MRYLIFCLGILLLPVTANAQALRGSIGYVEGNIGVAFVPAIQTKYYSFIIPPDTYAGHGELRYGNSFMAGAELGVTFLAFTNWRLAVSYDYTKLNLDSAKVTGTVNGAPGSLTIPAGTIEAAGFDFNNSVHLITYGTYYDFPMAGRLRPYAGVAVGGAFVQHANTRLALSATLGLRMMIGTNAYVGVRYRPYWIDGTSDKIGIEYKPILTHTVSALLGFYI